MDLSARPPRPVEAILFDKDGTLFDFAATWEVWAERFLLRLTDGDDARAKRLGHLIGFDLSTRRFAKDSIAIAGTPDEVALALHSGVPEVDFDQLVKILNDEAAAAPMAEVLPLGAFLDGLRTRGLKLGVATNDAEAPALAHLTACGVRDRFDFIAGSDSGFGAKPAPGQMLAFGAAVGVPAERSVMVGDSTHDLAAGRAAGMMTVAVLTGPAAGESLAPLADVVLPDIGAIPRWIDGA